MFHVKHFRKGRAIVSRETLIRGEGDDLPNEPRKKRRRWLWLPVWLIALLLTVCLLEGSVVRLEVSEVFLDDLPPAFDGLRIVYLSDLHLHTLNPLRRTLGMMEKLGEIRPDLILLGGDYCNYDPIMSLQAGSRENAFLCEAQLRDEFFADLSEIHPTYGIYAVAGEQDNLLAERTGSSLERAASLGGVTVLRDDAVELERDGQTLIVAGVDDWRTGSQDVTSLSQALRSDDCVILLSHDPDAVPSLRAERASDGGEWIDLALCGHLMGGQICLFGRALINPSIYADRYLSGWYREGQTRMLITRGVGSNPLPLRLGSPPQVHLITLRARSGAM